jgi:hypothetical protein
MGMFDWYEPVPPLKCPVCGLILEAWQGKDGPCGLFVWRQGCRSPVDQRVEAECAVPSDRRALQRLPDSFAIYADDPQCHRVIVAIGQCKNGVWTSTDPETPGNARPRSDETSQQFEARLGELRKWLGI